jgi:outer membrane receptor protein involved in Fe transport
VDGYPDDRRPVRQQVGSFTTVDLGIAYTFATGPAGSVKPFRIAFNVGNLFDQDPPRLLPDPLTTAGLGYDPVNASGRGRFVSLQLRKVW